MNTTNNFGAPNNNVGIPPQNYMALAIISTILGCCSTFGIGFILGIIAIYFASQVNTRYRNGDALGAEKNSKNAKILSFIAIGLMVLNLLYGAYKYSQNPNMFEEQMEQYQILMEQYEAEAGQ